MQKNAPDANISRGSPPKKVAPTAGDYQSRDAATYIYIYI